MAQYYSTKAVELCFGLIGKWFEKWFNTYLLFLVGMLRPQLFLTLNLSCNLV